MRTRGELVRLAALWFGIQLLWGAVLGVLLQARVGSLAGPFGAERYGAIAALGAWAAGVTQIAAGWWSDRRRGERGRGRAAFYLAGAAAVVPALGAFLTASSLTGLAFAFVALEVAANLAIGPYQAAVTDFVAGDSYGRASGIMGIAQSGAIAVGAVLAAHLHRPALLWTVLGAAVVLGAVATATAVMQRPYRISGEAHAAGPPRRNLVAVFVSRALLFAGFYTLLGYAYFYLRDSLALGQGAARAAQGTLLALFTIGGGLGAVLAGRPADRFDRRWVAVIGATLTGGMVLAIAAGNAGLPFVLAAGTLAGVGWGVVMTADWAIGSMLVPERMRATAMGIWNLAVLAPQALAPLAASALMAAAHASRTGGPRLALEAAAVETVAGAVLLVGLRLALPGKKQEGASE
jgi:MFS family permease